MDIPTNLIKSNQTNKIHFPVKKKREDVDKRIVLAFTMNPSMSLNVVDNFYFKDAFGCTMSRNNLKKKIYDFGAELEGEINRQLAYSVQCLVCDGAKDISRNKVLAIGLSDGSKVILYDMIDTELQRLDEEYFFKTFESLLKKIEKNDCFIPGIIMDNEASLRRLTDADLPLIHFRCGAHTLELLVDSLASHYKGLETAIDSGTQLANSINNCKQLLKALRDIQNLLKPNEEPLMLVPSNTRKWSSGYLVLNRLLKLQHQLELLKDREDLPNLPEVNWKYLKNAITVQKE